MGSVGDWGPSRWTLTIVRLRRDRGWARRFGEGPGKGKRRHSAAGCRDALPACLGDLPVQRLSRGEHPGFPKQQPNRHNIVAS